MTHVSERYESVRSSTLAHMLLGIYNSTEDFCNWTTPAACLTLRGGLYDTNSSTAALKDDVQDAGADASDTERATGPNIWYNSWATDDLSFGGVKLTEYPLGMPGFDIFTPYNR